MLVKAVIFCNLKSITEYQRNSGSQQTQDDLNLLSYYLEVRYYSQSPKKVKPIQFSLTKAKLFIFMTTQNKIQKYIFRPPTIPTKMSGYGSRDRERRNDVKLRDIELINRPNQNFFKLFLQRDKYLWVIFHKDIRNAGTIEAADLLRSCQKVFETMSVDNDDDLPICTDYQQLKKWTEQYQCKVAVDQSVGIENLFKVLQDENVVMVKVVTAKNPEIIKQIRKNRFSYKVRSIVDNFYDLLAQIRQDMQKIKIQTNNTDKIQKVRLPNFMKLRAKDKAQLIRYRNNIYCLINLNKNKTDLQASKKMFISQSQKMYTSNKQKNFINEYKSYPFNDEQILRFYTQDSFFFKCLNNTLRIAKSPQEFFIIGDPLNKMFHAIKNIYKQQFPFTESRRAMKLYRGADLSATETEYLQSCIGHFIQIQGFVSTTQDIQVAKKFARQRKHNKIIEILFDDIAVNDKKILENDYGFVNLISISRFQEKQILFNVLNIFKVVGKEKRDQFEIYTLKYGTIFNILGVQDPQHLKRQDRMAYHTYKELMGQKQNLEDLGQIFLKSNETQKSVDYYQAKIIEAKGQDKQEQVSFTIKKCQALIQNGEPSKALETIALLIGERRAIKRTASGARFLQSVLNDKEELIKQIDITKHYSEAGHDLDKFDEAQVQLAQTNEALSDALRMQDKWDFDVAFGQLQIQIQLAALKESVQSWNQSSLALKQAQRLVDGIVQKFREKQVPFHNKKKLYFQKTVIFQMMARISSNLEGQNAIDMTQLEKKYDETENILVELVQKKSYDKSLIEIRKAQILRHRKDFNQNKNIVIKLVIDSLFDIKQSSIRDSEVPKTYHMLAEMQKSSHTISSTQSAINYLEKQYCVNTQYYSQYDPKSMKTVIEIAQCQRELKNSTQSLELMKQQIEIIPFKKQQKHSVVSKVLYMMGMAYLDLGEFNLALKAFQKGINMLREILSEKEYQKYHYRFKIQLQLGRTMTFLLKYNQAEGYLNSYYVYVVKIHQNQHTEIANALNHYGILYMKWKKYDESKKKFQESQKMFQQTSGQKSLVCAKINCNLGMIYSFFNQKDKALRCIDQARQLFDFIYLEEANDKSEPVHRQSYMIQYYYADIYKKFQDYKLAIEAYNQSISKLRAFKIKEKKIKQQFLLSKLVGVTSIFKPSMIQKTEQHQLICKVKIIDCQLKLKDYSFTNTLIKIIADLERQIKVIAGGNQGQTFYNKPVVSQLTNLLDFCKKIQKNLKYKESKAFISEFKQSDVEIREIDIEPRAAKQ